MAKRKKAEIAQITKVRMRAELKDKLTASANRNKRTQNGELVHRLEESFANEAQDLRDSAIIDMLVDHNDVSSELLRTIASELAKHPEWFTSEAKMKDMVTGLAYSAHGKEPFEEPQPGDDE
jgi:hypothetical protein